MSSLDLRLFTEAEKVLNDLREKLASEVVSGKASDFADYRYRVGKLKGLSDAYEALVDVQRSVLGLERK